MPQPKFMSFSLNLLFLNLNEIFVLFCLSKPQSQVSLSLLYYLSWINNNSITFWLGACRRTFDIYSWPVCETEIQMPWVKDIDKLYNKGKLNLQTTKVGKSF